MYKLCYVRAKLNRLQSQFVCHNQALLIPLVTLSIMLIAHGGQ